MPYRAPIDDFLFLFDHVVDLPALASTPHFAEATPEMIQAILTEAARLSEQVLAPLQRAGDIQPAALKDGGVHTSPGFAEGYRAIADGGWIGMAANPEYGGMGLPLTVQTAVNEMMSGACLSLQLNPLMTQGQIEALEHHASAEIKALYLPKLLTGEWAGTMNLTEAQAGSDVGALASKAQDNGDGTYAITGQKIFISWGDSDVSANICHLVLARLPGGGKGTKGISLFLVPKFLPAADGSLGARNELHVVSLEHKLGLHGSPTAIMAFEGARGWMIGQPHQGMKAMFTMMNNARLGVGVQGLGAGEGAYQQALEFARERRQGRTPVGPGTGAIIDHADVRRMLGEMRAELFAARALALTCAAALDMAVATGDASWHARAAFLTPITKSYGTEVGHRVAQTGIQVHGGMGFIEETGAAQYARDVRVTMIYEGTNGIQAMDLVGRKMMDNGDAAMGLLEEIALGTEDARTALPELAGAVWAACETLREATEWMLAQTDIQERFAGAHAYTQAFALVLGAHFHLKAALAETTETGAATGAATGAKTVAATSPPSATSTPRLALAKLHIMRLLPAHSGLLEQARAGVSDLYANWDTGLDTGLDI